MTPIDQWARRIRDRSSPRLAVIFDHFISIMPTFRLKFFAAILKESDIAHDFHATGQRVPFWGRLMASIRPHPE